MSDRELLRQARDVLVETQAEILYWHALMLTPEERAHPRGSGWARVYDKLAALLTKIEEATKP